MSRKIKLDNNEPRPEKVKTGYDEKSPITGNFSVLVEKVEFESTAPDAPKDDIYKICLETGYQTYWNSWKDANTELIAAIESQMPKKIAAHRFVDSNGHVWYPMMTFSYIAALHPFINSQEQLQWAVSKVTPLDDESINDNTQQVVKLPVETNKGMTLGLFKIASSPDLVWEMYQFEDALNHYETVVNEWLEYQKQNAETHDDERVDE